MLTQDQITQWICDQPREIQQIVFSHLDWYNLVPLLTVDNEQQLFHEVASLLFPNQTVRMYEIVKMKIPEKKDEKDA